MLHVTYFFRKPHKVFHSIEELFFSLQQATPDDIKFVNWFAPFHSKGIWARWLIARAAAKCEADINHITGDIHFIAPFLKRHKTILTIHDLAPLLQGNIAKRWLLKLFWYTIPTRSVARVTVISEFTKKELVRLVAVNENKITVIPDCVSPLIQHIPKQFNTEKPNILQVGTKANKNLPRLIQALHNVSCKLTIVGQLSDEHKQLLRQYNIEFDNLCDVPFEQMIHLYRQADIVTFVSTYEGFGMPIVEAQATGRVVITSNVASMPEVAGNGALLVNPFDVQSVRDGILQLIQSASLREQLIRNGLINVQRFGATHVANRYAELYRIVKKYN